MLTTTYSLVAIANEQNLMRRTLRKVQQYIQNTWHDLHHIDFNSIELAFTGLRQFDRECHERKVELYLIPRIRLATSEADALLAELDALSISASKVLGTVSDSLARKARQGRMWIDELCCSMELYCEKILTRLAREESELFPIAQRLFSVEEWFSIAAQFLSEDDPAFGRRRQPAMLLPNLSAATGSGLRLH